MELKGARVLITGGAKRVGAEIARAFAKAGSRIVLHCRNSKEEARALLNEIGGESAGHMIVEADLSQPENIPAFFQKLPDDLAVLVNNASVFRRKNMKEETLAEAKEQFDMNFWTPAELIREFYKHSAAQELAVVNLLDQAIVKTPQDNFSYSLSKKALAELTRCAALQYAPRMRVNGVAPGPVFPPPGLENSRMEKTLRTIPLGRPVNPRDLADSCVFLAGNSSITGSVLFADCGQSLIF